MNYNKPFSKNKFIYSSLIIVLTLCSCMFFLFNCYNYGGSEKQDGIKVLAGMKVSGIAAITGKYCEMLEEEIKDLKDEEEENYDDYYYDEEEYDEQFIQLRKMLDGFEIIQVFSICILIVMIVMAIIEILVISIFRKKAGYITVISTSSIKLLIIFIQQLVLFIASSDINIIDEVDITFNYGFGMMFLVMIQILEILLCICLIFVHKYEEKIYKLNNGM